MRRRSRSLRSSSTTMSAMPVGASAPLEVEFHIGLDERRQRLVRERVVSHGCDQANLGAEPGGSESLVGALTARNAGEGRAGDSLARPRQTLAPRDEIEVDRPDDRDPRRHSPSCQLEAGDFGQTVRSDRTCRYAASARTSSTVEPSSVSRRSNSPAQRDVRSGARSRRAASVSPSSARTRTASSR